MNPLFTPSNMFASKQFRSDFNAWETLRSISLQIKTLRESRGMTQQDLASLLETSRSQISDWESGDLKSINLSTLLKIARVFDVALHARFIDFMQYLAFIASHDVESFIASYDPKELAELQGKAEGRP